MWLFVLCLTGIGLLQDAPAPQLFFLRRPAGEILRRDGKIGNV
jgi:hypothetical protein